MVFILKLCMFRAVLFTMKFKLSGFSDFDITQIQNERAKEKNSRQKLQIVRKLYLRTR